MDGAVTRRQQIQGLAGLVYAAAAGKARAANQNVIYGQATLPSGIRSRFVENVNGLRVHILEAGFESKDRPCVLLLHGFPELAYSWRKIMLPLAAAGFHVIAPDQRGRSHCGTRARFVPSRSLPAFAETERWPDGPGERRRDPG